MTTNLNQYPYFDDYDQAKDFLRILFRPGIPVQARELTQLQSILQNQIGRFGDHVFANGSRVTGAGITVNVQAYSVIARTTANSALIKPGMYIKGVTSGMIGEVIHVNQGNPATIVYIPRGAGRNTILTKRSFFDDNEEIYAYSNASMSLLTMTGINTIPTVSFTKYASTVAQSKQITLTDASNVAVGDYIADFNAFVTGVNATTGVCTLDSFVQDTTTAREVTFYRYSCAPTMSVGVADGVFYMNNMFVRNAEQQVIPSTRNRYPTATVGLLQTETFVTADDDATLLDPAQGSYNFTAPGADRLKVSLNMVSYTDGDAIPENFIELLRVEDGNIVRQNNYSTYSEIMKTLARRTSDESGDYVVKPFIVTMKDTGSPDFVIASMSPGKAYVSGYEFETIASYELKIPRARDYETANNFTLESYLGNYFLTNSIAGSIPAIGSLLTIYSQAGTQIGTANLVQLSQSANGMRVYVTNIYGTLDGAHHMASGSFTANIVGNLIDQHDTSLVYSIPQGYVKEATNITYNTARIYRNVSFNNGEATITAFSPSERFAGGSGTLSQSVIAANYAITNAGGNTISGVTNPSVAAGTPQQSTISVSNNLYNGVADIVVNVTVEESTVKAKTKLSAAVFAGNVSSNFVSLGYADLYKVTFAANLTTAQTFAGVWSAQSYPADKVVVHEGKLYASNSQTTSTSPVGNSTWTLLTDVSANLTVDDGQRDTHYDHAQVKSATAYNKLVVAFDYFAHSGTGPLTGASYPTGYRDAPKYTNKAGSVFSLSDCVDFRMRRTDQSTSLVFDNNITQIGDSITLDVSYYLSRIDKIVITADRNFKVLSGVSSYNSPLPPADISNAMTVCSVVLPPYTDDVSKISVQYKNNRRYTMRDIGKIETRLANVEHYTSLSSLENRVINTAHYDPSGTELFKTGFVTDTFDSFTVGDVGSANYRCSVDTTQSICRPPFSMNAVKMAIDTGLTTAFKSASLVTLPYTTYSMAENLQPTTAIAVNPFMVMGNIGVVSISPSSDYWFDSVSMPQINIVNENTTAFSVAEQNARLYNSSAMWSSWQKQWTGQENKTTTYETTTLPDGTKVTSLVETTPYTMERYKTTQTVETNTVIESDNTVVISRDVSPYTRSNNIRFSINGLTPFTQIFTWIDNVMVSSFVTPDLNGLTGGVVGVNMGSGGSGYTSAPTVTISGGGGSGATAYAEIGNGKVTQIRVLSAGSGYTVAPTVTIAGGGGTGATATATITDPVKGSPLVSNVRGSCTGVLEFPNTPNVKFPVGTHRIVFNDSMAGMFSGTSFAAATYTATGSIETTQRTVVSTKSPHLITQNVTDTQTGSNVTRTTLSTSMAGSAPTGNGTGSVVSPTTPTTPSTPSTPSTGNTGNTSQAGGGTSASTNTPKLILYAGYEYDPNAGSTDLSYSNGITDPVMILSVFNRHIGVEHQTEWVLSQSAFNTDRPEDTGKWTNTVTGNYVIINRKQFDMVVAFLTTKFGVGSIPAGTLVCTGNDPLAQSFVVEVNRYPYGCFIDSIDAFFESKDSVMPVIMEIRPMSNGYPSSSEIVPASTVVRNPDQINISADGTAVTKFKFDDPLYLAPGEYSVVFKTGSRWYKMWSTEMNGVVVGKNTIVSEQPYIGSLFESQNASTWTAVQGKDLCFRLNACKFDTTARTLVLKNSESGVSADIVRGLIQNLQPAGTGLTAYLDTGSNFAGYIPLNTDVVLSNTSNITQVGMASLRISMTSNSQDISPVVDLERTGLICVKNIINSTADWAIDETNPSFGNATAKYVHKKVTLNAGFNATSLVTYVNVNRPAGSDIKVYARMKNQYDSSNLNDFAWVPMNREINGGNTTKEGTFVEDKWSIYDYHYGNYADFNQYETKVVFVSGNTAKVPVITDVRSIALA